MRAARNQGGGSAAPGTGRRERTLGVLMLAGGAIAFVTTAMPPGATNSTGLLLVCGALGICFGTLLLIAVSQGIEAPTWLLGAGAALGTIMITLATWAGGFDDTASADNEILYLWVSLFSFYFFSRAHAFAQLALIAAAYATLLSAEGLNEAELTRLIVTLTTLLVSGILIAGLRREEQEAREAAEERARHDQLTGLFNRQGLTDVAAREFARSRREQAPVSFLIVDVDQFRTYNDLQGHRAGDELLKSIAESLHDSTRAVDSVAYLGADEFGIIMPGAGQEELEEVAARLLDDLHASWEGPVLATISVGAASGPAEGHTLDDLWQAAERALVTAQSNGGDQLRLARDPLSRLGS